MAALRNSLESYTESPLEASINVGFVKAVYQVNCLDGCLPVAVLGAVGGRFAQSLGLDAPFLSVGLDPAGELRPPGAVGVVGGNGAEELQEMARAVLVAAAPRAVRRAVTWPARWSR